MTKHGHPARRGQQFSGSPDSPDVVCESLPFNFEVKRVEALRLYAAMEQARADSGSDVPVVAHKKNGKQWVVIMDADDFMKLVAGGAAARGGNAE